MPPEARIYVAGHRGMVGGALLRCLQSAGYRQILTRTHAELDLLDQAAVRDFMQSEWPEYVFLAAARVGGIVANSSYPAEFIHQNLLIQANVIHEAWRARVKRLLFLGSSCIYPRDCPQPMKEEYLLSGPLESTNRPYALAKIAGIEMCWAYNRQYQTRFLAAMPTNLYGPADNYDLEQSHVIPALIRKVHEAKASGAGQVVVWGSGSPRREFLFSDDAADACLFLMNLPDEKFELFFASHSHPPLVNVGCGEDLTIRELVDLVKEVVGYTGQVVWDAGRPDGTPRKLLDMHWLRSLGWQPRIGLADGLQRAYVDFLANHP
ncbi:MAG: GDP-fucose synthetase [Deltaproteobacteria bacterium RIFOXYD12_FULL_57_12]|nr:MAG: GDP-fucose synthetase [Deltaproteobacteria bacterium RIFOXYD12_FULL_57_12]